ncbi:MAG: carboxypeptidase [Clostridiales bacterium]|nr:MAG: carboxypeptidase [Clostridiales bacterium]
MVKTIGIVSLSSGMLGEDFLKHELDIGLKRLREYGIEVKFMSNSLKGIEYLKENPIKRADDLIEAFEDESVDMILCAIGGDDTYRLLPYLFDDNRLKKVIKNKIFLGFSDTTMNHFMLHKVGLDTFYGQAFLPDVCELDTKMLPYTEKYFKELLETGSISEIHSSEIWYEEREDFSPKSVGTKRKLHQNRGFELLQGKAKFSGKILGGCLESMYDIFNNSRYEDTVDLCSKYKLFPEKEEWRGKILLIETSEEKPSVELFEKMLKTIKKTGVFEAINGILVGKPMDELHYEEYKKVLVSVVDNKELPILYNVNIGHALPRCIIPFGKMANVDAEKQVITFE